MAEQDEVRNDLDEELFAFIGKSVTLLQKGGEQYNIRGELEAISQTESTITIVPYNITHRELNQLDIGDYQEGDMFAAVRYDVDIDIHDEISMESENWTVTRVEKNYLPDNVATIVSLRRGGSLVASAVEITSKLLLESGDILLLESGDGLLLEGN